MKKNKQQKRNVTISKVAGMLQAIVIKEHLELIGVPVTLNYDSIDYSPGVGINISDEICIDIPEECFDEVNYLLTNQPPSGEIFSVPKEMM